MEFTSRSVSLDICEIDNRNGRIELVVSVCDGREISVEPIWVARAALLEFYAQVDDIYLPRRRASLSSQSGEFQLELIAPKHYSERVSLALRLKTTRYPRLPGLLTAIGPLARHKIPYDLSINWDLPDGMLLDWTSRAVDQLERLDRLAIDVDKALAAVGCTDRNPMFSRVGMPIPPHILALDSQGKWKMPADRTQFDATIGEGRTDDSYIADVTTIKHAAPTGYWALGTDDIFLGSPDPKYPPGDIDRRHMVILGDLGIGWDQIFALDYRDTPPLAPRVVINRYPTEVEKAKHGLAASRWVVLANTIEEFTHMIGID